MAAAWARRQGPVAAAAVSAADSELFCSIPRKAARPPTAEGGQPEAARARARRRAAGTIMTWRAAAAASGPGGGVRRPGPTWQPQEPGPLRPTHLSQQGPSSPSLMDQTGG